MSNPLTSQQTPHNPMTHLFINEDLLLGAKKLASLADISLPAEIPGFRGFFVAEADDPSVQAVTGFVDENGRSLKIGTRVPS